MKYFTVPRILENLNTRDKHSKCFAEPQTPVGTYLAHVPSPENCSLQGLGGAGQRLGWAVKFSPWELEPGWLNQWVTWWDYMWNLELRAAFWGNREWEGHVQNELGKACLHREGPQADTRPRGAVDIPTSCLRAEEGRGAAPLGSWSFPVDA